MRRPCGGRRQERQIDARGRGIRQLDLRDLGGLAQPGERHAVVVNVDPGLTVKCRGKMLDKDAVHIGAAELRVAARRLDLEDALPELHDRDIERAAAKVDDDNAQVLAEPIEAVGERGCSRLVDEPRRFEACDPASVLRRAALVVVKIGRHGDDCLLDRLAEKRLGVPFDLLQQQGRKLLRCELLGAQADLVALAH